MARTRRLPPAPISHIETHHAYTSPPIAEKGLPTIIVTPSNPVSPQDFQIHFFSNEVPMRKPDGFGLGLRRWFSRRKHIGFMSEKEEPFAQYAYLPIPTTEDEPYAEQDATADDASLPGYTSSHWYEVTTAPKSSWLGSRSRRLRVLLFLTIPLLLLLIHVIGYRLGFFWNYRRTVLR